MRKLAAIILVVSLIVGIAWWVASIRKASTALYDRLDKETDTYIEAAFLPGAANNPIRGELNRILGEALTEQLTEPQRLERARRGLVLLDELELQVDGIGTSKEALESSLVALETEFARVPRFLMSGEGDLRGHAERLYVIADDIRGLSYRANFHTAQIFERIISDGGVLSPEHVRDLNERIPQIEEQFDTRTNLYEELEGIASELDILFADFTRRSSQGILGTLSP